MSCFNMWRKGHLGFHCVAPHPWHLILSQSQPRTRWCSVPLTRGIPLNCHVTMQPSTVQSSSFLSCISSPPSPFLPTDFFLLHNMNLLHTFELNTICSHKKGKQFSLSPLNQAPPLSLSLSLSLALSLTPTPLSYSRWECLLIRASRFRAEGVLLLPGKSTYFLFELLQKLQRNWASCDASWVCGASVSRWHNQEGGPLWRCL